MKKTLTIILFFIFLLKNFAQTTIGAVGESNPSAVLELKSKSRGFLLPTITLKSNTDITTIKDPAVSLLVYNSGLNPNFPLQGYMSWNGREWRQLVDATSIKAYLPSNSILGTSLNPNSYNKNTVYDGILEVKYSGGNGGFYSKGEPYTHNGLTFELQAGKLETAGTLLYKITGKPMVDFPNKITGVPIIFGETTLATVAESSQYTLFNEITISSGFNGSNGVEKGYGGNLLKWGKQKVEKELVLPETGSYSFAFRFYGTTATAGKAIPVYLAAFKQNGATPDIKPSSGSGTSKLTDTLLDITEMTIAKPDSYGAITYSINLFVSGNVGDKIYFTVSSVDISGGFKWKLQNGGGDELVANRTSMVFWKL